MPSYGPISTRPISTLPKVVVAADDVIAAISQVEAYELEPLPDELGLDFSEAYSSTFELPQPNVVQTNLSFSEALDFVPDSIQEPTPIELLAVPIGPEQAVV